MKPTSWMYLPLWWLGGLLAGAAFASWETLLGLGAYGITTAGSVAVAVMLGSLAVFPVPRRVVHPLGRLPPLWMGAASMLAMTAIFHARFKMRGNLETLSQARQAAQLALALAAFLVSPLWPTAIRVAESRREGPRIATLLTTMMLLLGVYLGWSAVQRAFSSVDTLQLLLGLSMLGALCGVLFRRGALILTNAPAPPTRYAVVDAPAAATPPPRVLPFFVVPLLGLVLGIPVGQAPVTLLLAAPVLSLLLQLRRTLPLEAGVECARFQSALAVGACLGATVL